MFKAIFSKLRTRCDRKISVDNEFQLRLIEYI